MAIELGSTAEGAVGRAGSPSVQGWQPRSANHSFLVAFALVVVVVAVIVF